MSTDNVNKVYTNTTPSISEQHNSTQPAINKVDNSDAPLTEQNNPGASNAPETSSSSLDDSKEGME